jgi:uncharacterized protein YjiS (DUF1127 family)
MHAVKQPGAGRSRLPKLICPAEPDPTPAAPRRRLRLAGPLAGIARRLDAALAAWRARRRARRRLESWLTMDPRTLADLGLRRADVQAMVYAGGAGAQVAARGGRWAALAGATVAEARHRPAQLRLVAGDDLDAAA